jgi:ParB family chromosome partitioning protein
MKEPWSRWLASAARDSDAPRPRIQVRQIEPGDIDRNPNQPRTQFDEEGLEELAATLRTHGMIQPIVVRRAGSRFQLVAGERRLRAALKIGMREVPAIVRDMNDAEAASVALIENLQRESLTAIEEAAAYQQLIELHHLTQESLAQRLGKGQSTIANKMRLLNLERDVQDAIRNRMITERHARALLSLPAVLQRQVVAEIIEKKMTVKDTEARVTTLMRASERPRRIRRALYARDMRLAINTIRESISLVGRAGLDVDTSEQDEGDCYIFTIRVRKKGVRSDSG